MAIEIELTRGYVAIVDDCDADLANKNWQSKVSSSGCVYARRNSSKGHITLHVAVMERVTGRKLVSGEEVDHVDGDGRNNLRSNLRLTTHAGNMRNRKQHATNTSGYRGVSLDKSTGKWGAFIRIDGKKKRLGAFDTPELASEAYEAAAEKVFGEYMRVYPQITMLTKKTEAKQGKTG